MKKATCVCAKFWFDGTTAYAFSQSKISASFVNFYNGPYTLFTKGFAPHLQKEEVSDGVFFEKISAMLLLSCFFR